MKNNIREQEPQKLSKISDPFKKESHYLLYAFGNMGLMCFSFYLYAFLLIYGVSMLGLPTLFVGTIYSLSQLFYAILLPFFGNLSDQLRNSKIGSRVPLILIGIPVLITIFNFIWLIPPTKQFGILEIKTAFQYIILFLSYRFFFACVWAPYQAMIPDFSKNEKTQLQILANINIFYYIGQVLGTFLPVLILNQFPFPESAGEDYYWISNPNGIGEQIRDKIIMELPFLDIILVLSFACALIFTHVPKDGVENASVPQKTIKKISFVGFRTLLADKTALSTLSANILLILVSSSINYITINFAVYFLRLGHSLYLITILITIFTLSAFFVSTLLSSKFGLRRMLIFSSVLISWAFLFMGFVFFIENLLLIQIWAIILFCIAAFMAGSLGLYYSTIMTQLSSRAEKTTNQSIAGNYMSIYYSFGVIGNVVSVLIVSAILDWLGPIHFATYLWIFVGCGVISLGAVGFVRKIHLPFA